MRFLRMVFSLLALTLFLYGCAVQQYRQPPDDTPYATAVFPERKTPMSQTLGYEAYTNADCVDGTDGGTLALYNVFRADPKPAKLAVGKKIFIRTSYSTSRISNLVYVCAGMSSFVPEAGKKYRFETVINEEQGNTLFTLKSLTCQPKITDLDTGAAPQTFEIVKMCPVPKRL